MSVDKSPNLYSEGFSFVRRDNKKALSTCPSCCENCLGHWGRQTLCEQTGGCDSSATGTQQGCYIEAQVKEGSGRAGLDLREHR